MKEITQCVESTATENVIIWLFLKWQFWEECLSSQTLPAYIFPAFQKCLHRLLSFIYSFRHSGCTGKSLRHKASLLVCTIYHLSHSVGKNTAMTILWSENSFLLTLLAKDKQACISSFTQICIPRSLHDHLKGGFVPAIQGRITSHVPSSYYFT